MWAFNDITLIIIVGFIVLYLIFKADKEETKMPKSVRISPRNYERLKKHAIGFDKPNDVIARLIDFYESPSRIEAWKKAVEEKEKDLVEQLTKGLKDA